MQSFLLSEIKYSSMFCLPIRPDVNISWLDARDLAQFITHSKIKQF